MGGSLGAIDLARHNVAQLRLANALDAAAISAGRNLANYTPVDGVIEEAQWVDDARAFFHANMPTSYLGSTLHEDSLTIEYEEILSEDDVRHRIGQQINMSVSADLPLISTGYMGITSMDLRASNQALRRNRSDLEVVMVLDNSGSMNTSRMNQLKSASNLLVDMVLGAAEANDNSRTFIGLVPFTHVVNVGNNETSREWLTPIWRDSAFASSIWAGCITEPRPVNSRPLANVAPENNGPGYFRPLVWSDTTNVQVSNNPHSNDVTRAATFTPTPLGYRRPTSGGNYQVPTRHTNGSGNNTRYYLRFYYQFNPGMCSESRAVSFLSQETSAIKSAINSMYGEGGTAVPAGLLWGWRMLHPSWSGHWGGETVQLEDGMSASMPRPPHRDLTKVLILLTDGANSVAGEISTGFSFRYSATYRDNNNNLRSINNNTFSNSFNHVISNHNSLNDETTKITPGGGSNTAALDAFTRQLCTNIKNPDDPHTPGGIRLYTVAFGTAADGELMRQCASNNGYYSASNVNNLTQAFASIAGDLMELRLTK